MVLLVSGGHTMLIEMRGHGDYRLIGQTIDDAAGEAFDKVARFLDLGYPGGPAIDHASLLGDPEAIRFPRAMMDDSFDFSFSGLKTSVLNYVRKHPDVGSADVAASFQTAVVDVLVTKARRAPRSRSAQRASSSAVASPRTPSSANRSSTPASRTASKASCRVAPCAPTTRR